MRTKAVAPLHLCALCAVAAQGLLGCASSVANVASVASVTSASSAPPAREPPSEPLPPREATTEEKERADHRTGRVAGYVAIAIGVQATAVALVTSGMMLHEDGLRSDACDANKRCTQAGVDANDNLQQLGAWNAGAWAFGAVGLGVGTVLLLLHPSPSSSRPARTPAPPPPTEAPRRAELVLGTQGGPGLGLRGSF